MRGQGPTAIKRSFAILCALGVPWLVVSCVGPARTPAAAQAQSAPQPFCGASRAAVKARLTGLIASQTADGGIVFSERDAWIVSHPLLATMGFDACRNDGDASGLGGILDMASRYAAYVLARNDQDGDFLLERTSWTDGPQSGTIEDVGYNALFALDLLNLSRMCREADRPVDALYWYQGTRIIGKNLVQQTFDSRAKFFLPMNNASGRRENLYFGLSVMPTCFDDYVGPDLSRSILDRYLLGNETLSPESPRRYLEWRADSTGLDAVPVADAHRTALMLAALDHAGMTDEAKRLGADIAGPLAGRVEGPSSDDRAYIDYFTCLIGNGDYASLVPSHYELDLLAALAALPLVMPDEKSLHELETSVAALQGFLAQSPAERNAAEVAPIQNAMRHVYWTISALRAKWRTRTLFTPRERDRVPGFDIYAAFDELVERAIASLQNVETHMSEIEAARAGLDITSTAQNDVVVPGQPARFALTARATNGPVDVRSIAIGSDGSTDTLLSTSSPNLLQPGEARDYWHQQVSRANPGSLEPVAFSADVRLADGKRLRYYFSHGLYVTQPVTYSIVFPQGRTMTSGSVPVEIEITKHVDRSYVLDTEWYSPAGLKPREGRVFELTMLDKATMGIVRMNIPVPTSCRPGGFPFVVKIFGNGEDWGKVSGSLFKHYQWVFVGPFPTKENAMNVVYPPERSINLRERYPGVVSPISWAALPTRAYKDDGQVDLTSLLPRESVGYLHTVIETSLEKQTTVWLSSGLPAVVFINGREVIRIETPSPGVARSAVATLSRGMNNILIKLASGDTKRVFFQLGDEDDLTTDEFNNNLWELVDGFAEFYEQSQNQYGETETARIVTLTYRDTGANSVSVIGSFNGWSPANSNMRQSTPGQWEISLHLPPGRYAYRFLVNNNTQVVDPIAAMKEPDGYGGMNSVLYVR